MLSPWKEKRHHALRASIVRPAAIRAGFFLQPEGDNKHLENHLEMHPGPATKTLKLVSTSFSDRLGLGWAVRGHFPGKVLGHWLISSNIALCWGLRLWSTVQSLVCTTHVFQTTRMSFVWTAMTLAVWRTDPQETCWMWFCLPANVLQGELRSRCLWNWGESCTAIQWVNPSPQFFITEGGDSQVRLDDLSGSSVVHQSTHGWGHRSFGLHVHWGQISHVQMPPTLWRGCNAASPRIIWMSVLTYPSAWIIRSWRVSCMAWSDQETRCPRCVEKYDLRLNSQWIRRHPCFSSAECFSAITCTVARWVTEAVAKPVGIRHLYPGMSSRRSRVLATNDSSGLWDF